MRRRGFSLIELLMVVAILATLAAVALPRYSSSLVNYRADTAARRIIADLAAAQARAIATSANQTITFTPAQNRYTIAGMMDPDHPTAPYVVDLSLSPWRCAITSASLGGDAAVIFNGHGVPDSGGTIIVTSGAATRTITLDPDSGVAVMP